MIKRLICWIIKVGAGLVCIGGVITAILLPEMRVGGIVAAVVGFLVAGWAVKAGGKAKVRGTGKCKKCGASLSGADWKCKYDLGKLKKGFTLYELLVDITVMCPKCGKERFLCEKFEFADYNDAQKSIEKDIHDRMNTLLNG